MGIEFGVRVRSSPVSEDCRRLTERRASFLAVPASRAFRLVRTRLRPEDRLGIAGHQIRFRPGSGNLSSATSADTGANPASTAVAPRIRSNGSRWARSSLPAYSAASRVSFAQSPPCSAKAPGRPSRQSAISCHLQMRTFWLTLNRLTGLTNTASASAAACLAPWLGAGSSTRLRTQACVSRRTCTHRPSHVRSSSSFIGPRKPAAVPTLPFRTPRRNPVCSSGIRRTTGFLPLAITAFSPRSAECVSGPSQEFSCSSAFATSTCPETLFGRPLSVARSRPGFPNNRQRTRHATVW